MALCDHPTLPAPAPSSGLPCPDLATCPEAGNRLRHRQGWEQRKDRGDGGGRGWGQAMSCTCRFQSSPFLQSKRLRGEAERRQPWDRPSRAGSGQGS